MFRSDEYERTPISDASNGLVLIPDCYRARTPRARRQGLLGLETIPSSSGLLFSEAVVHMLGMRFALDLVFIDRARTIIKISAAVRPGLRLRGNFHSRYVLELKAGAAAERGLFVGQKLSWQ